MAYKNLANSNNPAVLIYLIDISGSMAAKMPNNQTRMDVTKDAIQIAYNEMISRSLRQGILRKRYRIAMIAYSDDIYDVYKKGKILDLNEIANEGVPAISPQKKTNMAKAFRYAHKLIREDIASWSTTWMEKCPPPMVINITDCEVNDDTEDPEPFAEQLKTIEVPDGHVLVENIFITDQIKIPGENVQDWKGYRPESKTGDPYGDKLLRMSSQLPASYAEIMKEQADLKISEGSAMMFPGINNDFIRTGFAMSIATGAQLNSSNRFVYPE